MNHLKQLKQLNFKLTRQQMISGFLILVAVACICGQSPALADQAPYPAMAALSRYLMSEKAEIALARSAAPASISDHAEVLVMGRHGYRVAVKGSNGFVCLVVRSWDNNFDNPGFWNPKMRAPYCDNAAAAHSVLPRYLNRTQWVLAGVSKTGVHKREAAELSAGKLKPPEPGSICYMMSKHQYLNDQGKSWQPHVMFYLPDTQGSSWGADLPGSPVFMGHQYADRLSVFMVLVPVWSDGRPAPGFK